MRTHFAVGLGLLLGLSVVCSGDDAATAPPTPPAVGVPNQPAAIKVVPFPWKTPGWQDAPDGNGQYLLFPSVQAQFDIDGHQYVATSLGVLVREQLPIGAVAAPPAPGSWKIVPELYLKNLQPLEMKGDVLWAVEGKSRRTQADPVHVLALDVKNWSVKQKLDLPPNAVPVRVENDGCWFVQTGPQPAATGGDVHAQGIGSRLPPGYWAIVLWDSAGKERFRFNAQEPPATPTEPTQLAAKRPPTPRIYWWGIDPDAVWLGIMDSRGGVPNDMPHHEVIYGPTQFIRVDRASGRRTVVNAPLWDGSRTVNQPQRILWLEMDSTPQGKRYCHVRQLDKKSLQISEAGRMEVGWFDDVAADENYLWVRNRWWTEGDHRPHAFALKDFSEVLSAGKPPITLVFRLDPPMPAGLALLCGDDQRVWLSVGQQIIELLDDGDALIREMPPQVMPSPFVPSKFVRSADAQSGSLYAAVVQLFRVTSGSDQVLVQEAKGFFDLQVGAGSLWVRTRIELLAFSDGLVLEQRVPVPPVWAMTVVGKTCFYFTSGNAPGLFKLDFAGGEAVRIESWDKRTLEWLKNTYKLDEPAPDSLKRMSHPLGMTTDGAGKVFLLFYPPSDLRRDVNLDQVGTMVWTYDIARDEWQDRDLGTGMLMTTINAGPNKFVLFNKQHKGPPGDPGAYLDFSNGRLEPLGPLPKGWLDSYDYWRIHTTHKYIYAWTPLGLWRALRK